MDQYQLKSLFLSPLGKFILLIIIILLAIILFLPTKSYIPNYIKVVESPKKSSHTINVAGRSEELFSPDMVKVYISIIDQDKSSKIAIKNNSLKERAIISALKNRCNLKNSDIETSGYSLIPIWTQRPKTPPKNWRSRIIGYKVVNRIEIRTSKLKDIGKIIATAVEKGADRISNPTYYLKDISDAKSKVIEKAVENCKKYAQTIAKEANTKIISIKNISVQNIYTPVYSMNRPMMMLGANRYEIQKSTISPNIIPKKITIRAYVNAVYNIE